QRTPLYHGRSVRYEDPGGARCFGLLLPGLPAADLPGRRRGEAGFVAAALRGGPRRRGGAPRAGLRLIPVGLRALPLTPLEQRWAAPFARRRGAVPQDGGLLRLPQLAPL